MHVFFLIAEKGSKEFPIVMYPEYMLKIDLVTLMW